MPGHSPQGLLRRTTGLCPANGQGHVRTKRRPWDSGTKGGRLVPQHREPLVWARGVRFPRADTPKSALESPAWVLQGQPGWDHLLWAVHARGWATGPLVCVHVHACTCVSLHAYDYMCACMFMITHVYDGMCACVYDCMCVHVWMVAYVHVHV